MLKVAVFDDNLDRREGLCLLIDTAPEMTCVGTFEDCRDVVRHVAETNPDVVLMDIDMPHVNGIEGVELIKRQFPKVKVLMQTVFEDDDKVFAAILAGADGYLLKQSTPNKLLEAIEEVLEVVNDHQNVDRGFGREPWHSSASDVLDRPSGRDCVREGRAFRIEAARPLLPVRNHLDR